MPRGWQAVARLIRRMRAALPETAPRNLPGRYRALERRRARNKVARASRRIAVARRRVTKRRSAKAKAKGRTTR